MERLADEQVCLDVCPTSNVMLGVVESYSRHPLPQLLASGILVSVNADDPLMFGIGILDEYERCRHKLHCSDETLAGIALTSIAASGASEELKATAESMIRTWLTSPAQPSAGEA